MNIWFIDLVVGEAFSHAKWNLLLKKTEKRLLMMTAMHSITRLISLVLLPVVGSINEEAWKFLILSVLIHGGYFIFLTYSYRHIELGQAYPILRGSGPLIVFLVSLTILEERIPDYQILAFS